MSSADKVDKYLDKVIEGVETIDGEIAITTQGNKLQKLKEAREGLLKDFESGFLQPSGMDESSARKVALQLSVLSDNNLDKSVGEQYLSIGDKIEKIQKLKNPNYDTQEPTSVQISQCRASEALINCEHSLTKTKREIALLDDVIDDKLDFVDEDERLDLLNYKKYEDSDFNFSKLDYFKDSNQLGLKTSSPYKLLGMQRYLLQKRKELFESEEDENILRGGKLCDSPDVQASESFSDYVNGLAEEVYADYGVEENKKQKQNSGNGGGLTMNDIPYLLNLFKSQQQQYPQQPTWMDLYTLGNTQYQNGLLYTSQSSNLLSNQMTMQNDGLINLFGEMANQNYYSNQFQNYSPQLFGDNYMWGNYDWLNSPSIRYPASSNDYMNYNYSVPTTFQNYSPSLEYNPNPSIFTGN